MCIRDSRSSVICTDNEHVLWWPENTVKWVSVTWFYCVIRVHWYVCACKITSLCVQQLQYVPPLLISRQIYTLHRQIDSIWPVYMNSPANKLQYCCLTEFCDISLQNLTNQILQFFILSAMLSEKLSVLKTGKSRVYWKLWQACRCRLPVNF